MSGVESTICNVVDDNDDDCLCNVERVRCGELASDCTLANLDAVVYADIEFDTG